jgi:hypothetical protein
VLDLTKLDKEITDLLEQETEESLKDWLGRHRAIKNSAPVVSYASEAVQPCGNTGFREITEQNYINIGNRIKVNLAQNILRDILILDNDEIILRPDYVEIQSKLHEWSNQLFNKIKITEQG